MKIELDGIPLSTTVMGKMGQQQEVRSIRKITTTDRRNVMAYDVPGMEGSTFQNLGRSAVLITFDGLIIGKGARSVLETIRSKYKSGLPLPFNSDITGATDVTKVIVQELTISESTELMDHFEYIIVLKEFKEPPPEPTTPPAQDEEAEEWAEEIAAEALDSKNKVKGSVKGEDGQPVRDKEVVIACDGGEYLVTTDENGDYYVEDLPPGEYEVAVNDPAYDGQSQYIVVGGADSTGPVGEARLDDEVRQASTDEDAELRQIEAEVEGIAGEIAQLEKEALAKIANNILDNLFKSDLQRLIDMANRLISNLSNPEQKLQRFNQKLDRIIKLNNRIYDLKVKVRNYILAQIRKKLKEVEKELSGPFGSDDQDDGDGGEDGGNADGDGGIGVEDDKGPLSDDGEGAAGTQGSDGGGIGGKIGGESAGYQTEDDNSQGYTGGSGEKGDLKDDGTGTVGSQAEDPYIPPTGGA